MLVLTRKPGQSIMIGDDIRVTLVSLRGDQVRIGIDAPQSVTIDRAEVHRRRMQFQPPPQSPPTIVTGPSDTVPSI